MNKYKFLIFTTFFTITPIALADCLGPPPKILNTEIFQCNVINPQDRVKLVTRAETSRDSSEILKLYEGLEIETPSGKLFISANLNLACSNIELNKPTQISVNYACCDGDPNPPCFLGYNAFVDEIE